MRLSILISSVMLLLGSCSLRDEADQERFVKEKTLQAQVDTFLFNHPEVPGIISAWKLRDNSFIKAGAGYANLITKEAMTPFHKVGVASNTKVMTSTIILQLWEEGKIKLSDPLSKYVSEEIIQNISVIDGISYGHLITIKQLLKNTSGVYDFVDDNFINATAYFPHKQYTPEDLIKYVVISGKPYFVPGTPGHYHYSSTNFILLGMVIEKVTGKAYHQVLRERIFTPLQMNGSSVWQYEPQAYPVASGYNYTNDISNDNLSWTWATGGVVSDAADMNLFIKSLLKGLLFKKQVTLAAMLQTTDESLEGYGYEYGLGIMKYNFGNGFTGYGHIGSLHGYNSACFYLPLHDASFFIALNKGNAQTELFDLMGQCYSCVITNYEYKLNPPFANHEFRFPR